MGVVTTSPNQHITVFKFSFFIVSKINIQVFGEAADTARHEHSLFYDLSFR